MARRSSTTWTRFWRFIERKIFSIFSVLLVDNCLSVRYTLRVNTTTTTKHSEIKIMTQAQQIAAFADMTTEQLVELAENGFRGAFYVNTTVLLNTLTRHAISAEVADRRLAIAAE